MNEELLTAIRNLVIKGRENLEDEKTPKETRDAFLQDAASLARNPVLHDLLSRIAEDAHTFIVSEAKDMESIFAHRAILIVADTLKEQIEHLAALHVSEQTEAENKVDAPQQLI